MIFIKNKIIVLTLFFILILSTTSLASVNYMDDQLAEALYKRLNDNYDYYTNELNGTRENVWQYTSAEEIQNMYNTNETIQNFIENSVNSSSFGNVFFIQLSGVRGVTLYIMFCDENNYPTITTSTTNIQIKFQSTPWIRFRCTQSEGLEFISANNLTILNTSSDNTELYYKQKYNNITEAEADITITDDTITKVANFIPFIFNGADIEFPFSEIYYNGNFYRLDKALPSGYVEPSEPSNPVYNNGEITGTLTPSGDDYIINAQLSGELDYGQGNAELGSGDFENLKNEANEIIGAIVPSNNIIGMFYQIISGFNNTLIGTGEETIEFDYQGKHYIISSSQITLPISEIKTFTGLFFDVAIIIAIGLSISYIIRKMEEGDVISVLSLGDADMYFYYNDLNMF